MRGANKVTAKVHDGKKRRSHAINRARIPMASKTQNLNNRKIVGSKNGKVTGRIQDLDDGLSTSVDDVRVGPVVKRPIEQALENWRIRQSNCPWWWLSFSVKGLFKGVVVAQGWNFLDALNNSNKQGLSVVGAAVFGEELNDMAALNDEMVNRLLSESESREVFVSKAGPSMVDEVTLYKQRESELKFRAKFDNAANEVKNESVN